MIAGASNNKWIPFEEDRTYYLSNGRAEQYMVTGLKRADGLTVIRESASRNGATEVFLFKGNFGEFKIRARRYDDIENKIWDRYVVYIYNSGSDEEKEMIKAHNDDITSALIHFPVSRHFNNIPVKTVAFQSV
jgi:hypothetical protein